MAVIRNSSITDIFKVAFHISMKSKSFQTSTLDVGKLKSAFQLRLPSGMKTSSKCSCSPACCSADAYSQGRVIVVIGKLQSAFIAYAPAPFEVAEYCHLSSLVVKQVRDQHIRKLMLDKERLVALRDRQLSLIAKLSQSCDHDSDQVGHVSGNIASSTD